MLAAPVEAGGDKPRNLLAREAAGGRVLNEGAGLPVQAQLLLVAVAQAQHLPQCLQDARLCIPHS